QLAVDDGVTHMACTPHVKPGLYPNNTSTITSAISLLSDELEKQNIPLQLLIGADVHIDPKLLSGLTNRIIPSLNNTRYFLFEPTHQVMPPKIVEFASSLLRADYIPILTHPERLSWIEDGYNVICRLDEMGVPMQLTAGSITGKFGSRVKYWSERMLAEGRIDIIASDAHNIKSRPPGLSEAAEKIEKQLGKEAMKKIVHQNPLLIINDDVLPEKVRREAQVQKPERKSGVKELFSKLLK
ncbi:MAG: CpsB/CapC family capsule biosynthesis tyrosine phosphatase, partial [Pseudomonadota bacterium]